MKECWFCGSQQYLQMHHVFAGAYRKKSTKYGFVVPLCMACHLLSPDGVHVNQERNLVLKRWAQEQFEETHTRQEFREVFGKNYLEDDDE